MWSDRNCNELVIYEVNSQKDMYELEKLKLGIKSAISSKQYGLENFLSELVGKACLNSMPQIASNFIVDNIRTVKILGMSSFIFIYSFHRFISYPCTNKT